MYVIVTQKANIKNVMYASKRQLEILHESMPCMLRISVLIAAALIFLLVCLENSESCDHSVSAVLLFFNNNAFKTTQI